MMMRRATTNYVGLSCHVVARNKKRLIGSSSSSSSDVSNVKAAASMIEKERPKAKVLTLATLNPNVLAAQYAVRGELAILADSLRHVNHTHAARTRHGHA